MENQKLLPFSNYCPMCDAITTVYAKPEDVWRWEDGELIQNAMPYLKPCEREVFISGLCYECQKKNLQIIF